MVLRKRRKEKPEVEAVLGRAAVIVRSVSAVLVAIGNVVRVVNAVVVEVDRGPVIANAVEAVTGIVEGAGPVIEDAQGLDLVSAVVLAIVFVIVVLVLVLVL